MKWIKNDEKVLVFPYKYISNGKIMKVAERQLKAYHYIFIRMGYLDN